MSSLSQSNPRNSDSAASHSEFLSRKAVAVACLLGDELRLRTPNLIPPSLRMLVGPVSNVAKTVDLIDDILNKSRRNSNDINRTQAELNSDYFDDDTIYGMIDDLRVIAEQCVTVGRKYPIILNSYSACASDSERRLDANLEELHINEVGLHKLTQLLSDAVTVEDMGRGKRLSGMSFESVSSRQQNSLSTDDLDDLRKKIESVSNLTWK
jgi:hypothetical protein